MEDVIKRGRPPVGTKAPRTGEVKVIMPWEMYALLLEYSNETGAPLSWLGRKLFGDFLRSVGKME